MNYCCIEVMDTVRTTIIYCFPRFTESKSSQSTKTTDDFNNESTNRSATRSITDTTSTSGKTTRLLGET